MRVGETNKQWERLSGKHKAVVTVETGEGESAVFRGRMKRKPSPALLSVRLSLDGNVLLHSFFLTVFDCLLLNNRPSRVVCIFTTLYIWLG